MKLRKPVSKNFAVTFCLLFVVIATMAISACNKSNDNTSVKETANSEVNAAKFASNEWPTFTITKEQLSRYLEGNISGKKITVMIRSEEWSSPKASMTLTAFGDNGRIEILKQDENNKTALDGTLSFSNNLISLSRISGICMENDNWVDNFEYIRLTPIESNKFSGYIAFKLYACDKDGNIIKSGAMARDGGDDGNPSPPKGCCDVCPPGQHCNSTNDYCIPN